MDSAFLYSCPECDSLDLKFGEARRNENNYLELLITCRECGAEWLDWADE